MQRIREIIVEEYGSHKSLSQVDKILKNPFYTGVMRVKGVEYAHHYTPIINRELYDSVQGAASRFKKQPFKYAGLPYFYRGIITCHACGCRITPERSKGLIYYHCTQYKGKHGARWVREEELSAQFEQAIDRIHPSQQQYDEVVNALKLSHSDKVAFKAHQLGLLQASLTKTESRLSRLYDSYLDGDITKEFYKTKQLALHIERDQLNIKISSIDRANKEYYDNAIRVMELVRNAPLLFRKITNPEEKRQILNMLFQNLELEGDQLRWKYKKPFNSMASYKNDSSWLG